MQSRTLYALAAAVLTAGCLVGTAFATTVRISDVPVPSAGSGVHVSDVTPTTIPPSATLVPKAGPGPFGAPPLSAPAVEGFNYVTNGTYNGTFFIPPDPHCAAGPTQVINIGNCLIEWRRKAAMSDTPDFLDDLKGFFSALPAPAPNPGPGTTLGTATFDPKVIYDQYAQRFVVITLERWDTASGNPSNQSRILVAVSKDSNPDNGFWFHAIDSKVNVGGLDRWADYPGLAVDDKAIYITNNMFAFLGAGGSFGASLLWIIPKTGAYSGPNNALSFALYDAYAAVGQSGFAQTTQPAHMFGAPGNGFDGNPLGTFLVSYGGLSDGLNEYLDIIQVTDPLGTPNFNFHQFSVGNVDNTALAQPDAPQLGSAYTIETNDRRALNAVWRDRNLYMCAVVVPPAGADAGQTTAHWWRLSTVNPAVITTADQGNVGAEDLGAGTHTFFPSVMVDCDLNMAIGFAASNAAIYPGAYYTTRLAGDPAGTVSGTGTLHAGVDFYKRFFSGPRNRWGDYSGLALCPVGESDFWVFNEYAGTRGNASVGSQGAEDGRWNTALGVFRVKAPTAAGDTPVATRLAQNIPNPFNPTTSIQFTLEAREHVTIAIYDANGALVRTLVDEVRSAGANDVTWDGRDARGNTMSSGVYFCRLTAGGKSESRKMTLLK
ncbi:MAG: T9SS type A sorting domain-containing protein [Candidatus Krumholzibacteria bacterium]|nr:T9SS type A sorting domain-containing protein [Candidatus Krumholzibacteria bacterium]MDH4337388.1 T9SS type A sorting domain-containing protein [Candidatus Krumholzibacteria bacterium]